MLFRNPKSKFIILIIILPNRDKENNKNFKIQEDKTFVIGGIKNYYFVMLENFFLANKKISIYSICKGIARRNPMQTSIDISHKLQRKSFENLFVHKTVKIWVYTKSLYTMVSLRVTC